MGQFPFISYLISIPYKIQVGMYMCIYTKYTLQCNHYDYHHTSHKGEVTKVSVKAIESRATEFQGYMYSLVDLRQGWAKCGT